MLDMILNALHVLIRRLLIVIGLELFNALAQVLLLGFVLRSANEKIRESTVPDIEATTWMDKAT